MHAQLYYWKASMAATQDAQSMCFQVRLSENKNFICLNDRWDSTSWLDDRLGGVGKDRIITPVSTTAALAARNVLHRY